MKIKDIKEESDPITVEGTVLTTPNIREVVTFRKKIFMGASFDLMDDTGQIMVFLWKELVEIVNGFFNGIRIKLENVFIRRGFSSQLELTSRASTSVGVLSKPQTHKYDPVFLD